MMFLHPRQVRRRRLAQNPLLLHLPLRDDLHVPSLVLLVQIPFRIQLPARDDSKERVFFVEVFPENICVVLDQRLVQHRVAVTHDDILEIL